MELIHIDRHKSLRQVEYSWAEELPEILGCSGERKQEASAAAVGPGIAPVNLLDVKLFSAERGSLNGLPAFCAQIALVRGVAAPFPQTAPEAGKRAVNEFGRLL